MASAIFLARHGQDEDNAAGLLNGHRDMPLTALGVQQAEALGKKVAEGNIHFDAILCSPLQRAKITAEAVGAAIDVPVVVLPDLIERDFGVLTGRPLTEIPTLGGEILETDKVNYFLGADKAETFPTLLIRARRVLEHVHEACAGKRILLVCHGDIAKMIQAAHYGWDWKTGLQAPYIANTDIIELAVQK
jgi:broad specificity phosphatase PhoE